MYSLLLMTAMAGGADTPSFGGRFFGGCHGCHGAVVSYSCYGSSCNGCWGSSCHGCWGNSCHGGFIGRRNLMHRQGCTGISCPGCWGSSSQGCWGASCHGCAGSVVGGVSYYDGAVIVMPSVGTAKVEPEDSISANLIVELPSKAKLYVDGRLIEGDAISRKFHTPILTKGKTYYYDLKAEITIAGKPVVEERKVLIKAGETITEKFEKLASAVNADAILAAK